MELYVLGCGGMMPLPNRHLTSVLLRREGELLLFDCGEATQISLRRLNLKWKKISTIFISHTHADHVTGLPGLLMLSSQVERDEPLTIIGPPRIAEYIKVNCKALEMYINYEIIVKEIENPGIINTVMETDDFIVQSIPLSHSRVCVGYVLTEKDRAGEFFPEKAKELKVPCGPLWSKLQLGESVTNEAGETINPVDVLGDSRPGKRVSFVTDTLFRKDIAENVMDSDLLICEGMFEAELKESAIEKKHMTAEDAAHIAVDANVAKMGLIHYSPRYNDRELDILQKEASAIFPKTFLCRDRMKIDIPGKEKS